MKKSNIIIILLILFTSSIFAQSNFDKGFEVGYKKGFCQDQGIGCMEPITPIPPVPGVDENYNSYSDGYNRGFTMGLKKRKTIKSENTVLEYSKQARKYNKTESSINLNYINYTLKNKQSIIDYNKDIVEQTLENISQRKKSIFKALNSSNILEETKINLSNKYNELISDKVDSCSNLAEFESITGTQNLVNCFNFVHHLLDNLESDIYNYSILNNRNIKDKAFIINSTGEKNIKYCDVTKIFNKDDKTIVEFEYTSPYEKDMWININPDTYIYDYTNDKRLKLIGIWNTEYSPKHKVVQYNKKITFQLIFEGLQNNSKIINIIECESRTCFNFYGIYIK